MDATLIYPHQLFRDHPALAPGRLVYMVEEPLLLTHNPVHRARLLFLKLAMDAYERELKQRGYKVWRISIHQQPNTNDVWERLKRDGITTVHVVDTTDDYLERAVRISGLTRIWYESPLFFLAREDAIERYHTSNRHMAAFYKQLRRDARILIDDADKPTGGAWSFDKENREPLKAHITIPDDLRHYGNAETADAATWAQSLQVECYGEANVWLPYTHDGAREWLRDFFRERFDRFGTYEDAIAREHTRLFHSTISPLLNIGLLTPREVLDEVLAYAVQHDIPINSLEGFVRQVLGWREFMRAAYEADGRAMRTRNFFSHDRALPQSFWDGTTDLVPVDAVITRALTHGYTHHIERLMVMGNIMLLLRIHPDEVYRWFMGMYIDAYDWVMVPNVYGMSQFADGGSFATKPYISGSNYLKKMSDFQSGEWEQVWTALYWQFIADNRKLFRENHRLAMMPQMYKRLSKEKRDEYNTIATKWLHE